MSQNNTPYGADSGYDRLPAGLTGGGDTYEERGCQPVLLELRVDIASLSIDATPIISTVRIHAGEAAGVELGA